MPRKKIGVRDMAITAGNYFERRGTRRASGNITRRDTLPLGDMREDEDVDSVTCRERRRAPVLVMIAGHNPERIEAAAADPWSEMTGAYSWGRE